MPHYFGYLISETPPSCRLLGLLILGADIAFIICDISLTDNYKELVIFHLLDLVFSAYFCVEVSLRIIGLGYVNHLLKEIGKVLSCSP